MFGRKVSESKIVKILERRIDILEARETDLINRLMSKSYGEYVLGTQVLEEKDKVEVNYPIDAQDETAGTLFNEKS